VDFVPDILAKCIPVWSTRRILKRNIIGNQNDFFRIGWAFEGINVGIVSQRIARNQGRFTVARSRNLAVGQVHKYCQQKKGKYLFHVLSYMQA
jgi:hypothetical protein